MLHISVKSYYAGGQNVINVLIVRCAALDIGVRQVCVVGQKPFRYMGIMVSIGFPSAPFRCPYRILRYRQFLKSRDVGLGTKCTLNV